MPSVIEFEHLSDGYTGSAATGRRWRITAEMTGWRLGFRDPGDVRETNAGVYATVDAAMAEARR